jgi:membrane protein
VSSYAQWHRTAQETEAAAAVAFWLLLALGPAGIVVINVLGLVTDQESVADHLAGIALASPGSFGDLLVSQFAAVAAPSPGSWRTDVLMVLVSLWTISAAVAMLLRGLRRGYGLPRQPFSIVRAVAAATGMLAILALGALAFVVDAESAWQRAVGAALSLVAAVIIISGLHVTATSLRVRWRQTLPGAVLAALALALIQVGYESLAARLAITSAGSGDLLGGIVTSMLALWLAALVVLIGPFVNTQLSSTGPGR